MKNLIVALCMQEYSEGEGILGITVERLNEINQLIEDYQFDVIERFDITASIQMCKIYLSHINKNDDQSDYDLAVAWVGKDDAEDVIDTLHHIEDNINLLKLWSMV